MHELSVAYDIYATARRAAQDHQASQVSTVFVEIGEMAMINPEQVEFLFHTIADEDPVFSGSDIKCTVVKVHTRCSCGYEGDEAFVCPRCGAMPEMVRGREVMVTNIEIEVDDEK